MAERIIIKLDSPEVIYLCNRDRRLAKLISMVGEISYEPHDGNSYAFMVHEIIEQMLSVKAGRRITQNGGGIMAGKNIKVTPATKPMHSTPFQSTTKKRRVAAYARVSTDKEEQESSFDAQVNYYTRIIKANPEWIFVDVYADEGITGTSITKREGFTRMINDALAGRIDLIMTKSVSRFARNTVDSLTTVRKLKEKGVEVYFEKENIYTLDSKGELLITIMSSLAQEEARNISENTAWGRRKQFAEGKHSLAYKTFLGFDKGPDGGLVVNKEQAATVRRIYSEFLAGNTPYMIAKGLTRDGIKTPGGKDKWQATTIRSMLSN